MEELFRDVQVLINDEYGRAAEKFGDVHHSDHEAFAVALEELEESADELNTMTRILYDFWSLVKSKDATDADKLRMLSGLQRAATFAACEVIQVAAMALKAQKTIQQREEQN